MKRTNNKLSDQIKRHAESSPEPDKEVRQWADSELISTGSTLLDLAISGGCSRRGGIPAGVLVEVFGPSSTGKTVLLSEIAGGVRRQGGEVKFCDPESRLNRQFAKLFDLDVDDIDYYQPSTVPEVFAPIREWNPEPTEGTIHGVFADSLAALTTDMEMDDNDAYGMRRAKEFSEECRKTCRELAAKNVLMVCSNQVRVNVGAGPYQQKWKTPGGEAVGFYSSLRLRTKAGQKITRERKIRGKKIARTVGVQTEVEIFKSSIWEPYRSAPLYILFDYGIDDIRANLQFVKTTKAASTYQVGDLNLGKGLDKAIEQAEEQGLERRLEKETIGLWREIEKNFRTDRKSKRRRK